MSWLPILLLLLSASSIHADNRSPASFTDNPNDVEDAQLRSAVDEPSPKTFGEFVNNATLSAAFSGCGLCQQTGQCGHAYHGQPGQFCIGLASGAPCCCPVDAQCAATPYECRCRRAAPYHYGGYDGYHSRSSSSGGVFSTILFIAMVLLCCVCCCYLPARRAQQEREEQYAYAQPVASSQYGTYADQQQQPPQAPYAYASAPVAYGASPYRESGGGNGGHTMAAGALGALGGLGVGAALGSAFGGHNNNTGYAGDTGDGYDNAGYSGDVGGVGGNTYTFSGDTGGGDDFGGDGGDDGTFAGDS
uniref:Uncharacterized protein n=1 Tax=Peronospora matthiolae TaxID=2874970 RepID=A0AAV1UME5_9STRA